MKDKTEVLNRIKEANEKESEDYDPFALTLFIIVITVIILFVLAAIYL